MLDLAVLVAKCMPAVTVPPAATGTAGHEHAILSPAQADNPRS
jgi:hypothetical protein